jgi:glycine cleavage system H protein
MEAETVERWRRELSGDERICRYARMGVIPYKICPSNFECFRCEVDQRMEDTFGTHPALALRPAGAKQAVKVGEFVFRPDVLYHPDHVWVRPLNGKVMLGLDDFAQRLFGSVKDISLSTAGKSVNSGDVAWEIDCEDKHVKMLFPFGGRIADVNPDVLNDPSLVQKDSYSRGWIYVMVPSEEDYSARLLSRSSAKEWLISEGEHLQSVTNGVDPPTSLPDEKWNSLVRELFLSRG